jgi:hypothetical protein
MLYRLYWLPVDARLREEFAMANAAESAPPISPGPVRRWVMQHDDSWLFIVPYIGLAVVLSIVISLFWLVAVVAVHFGLEWMRQVYLARSTGQNLSLLQLLLRVLWELKLDVVLVLFALVLSLYMEFTMGVVGLGTAGRAGTMTATRVGTRFAVIQRVLRGVLLSLDDLAQVIRVLARRKSKAPAASDDDAVEDAAEAEETFEMLAQPGWRRAWGKGDYFTISFGVICVVLIMLAPVITHHDTVTMWATLAEELHPFPVGD